MKLAARIALGIALLAAVVWYVEPRSLARSLAAIDARWFAAAVAASVISNVFSAARWAAIARGLGLVAPLGAAIAMYFRGMTMNVLLPGATVSGDLLRGYQLAQQQRQSLAHEEKVGVIRDIAGCRAEVDDVAGGGGGLG